ncbi:hypothetical protein V8C34DRAFT_273095 [Trichoderma compactum]
MIVCLPSMAIVVFRWQLQIRWRLLLCELQQAAWATACGMVPKMVQNSTAPASSTEMKSKQPQHNPADTSSQIVARHLCTTALKQASSGVVLSDIASDQTAELEVVFTSHGAPLLSNQLPLPFIPRTWPFQRLTRMPLMAHLGRRVFFLFSCSVRVVATAGEKDKRKEGRREKNPHLQCGHGDDRVGILGIATRSTLSPLLLQKQCSDVPIQPLPTCTSAGGAP